MVRRILFILIIFVLAASSLMIIGGKGSFVCIAMPPGFLTMIADGTSVGGYHADTSFVWECTSTTAEYARSSGDTSATAYGSDETITGGECVMNDSSSDGLDYWYFDVSSDDIIDEDVGTVFIKFYVTTWKNGIYMFNPWVDSSNTISLETYGDNDLYGYYKSTGSGSQLTQLTGSNITTGTWWIIRYRWDTSRSNADHQLTLYTSAMVLQEDSGAEDDITAFAGSMGANDLYIGQDVSTADSNIKFDYVHIYYTWRDTDPNAS